MVGGNFLLREQYGVGGHSFLPVTNAHKCVHVAAEALSAQVASAAHLPSLPAALERVDAFVAVAHGGNTAVIWREARFTVAALLLQPTAGLADGLVIGQGETREACVASAILAAGVRKVAAAVAVLSCIHLRPKYCLFDYIDDTPLLCTGITAKHSKQRQQERSPHTLEVQQTNTKLLNKTYNTLINGLQTT